MGGKTSTTTQQVKIPPEVLARYNAVNTRAEKVAENPFQQYGTTAEDFVAQLNAQQYRGIDAVNQAAGAYRPYFDQAASTFAQGLKSAQPSELNVEKYMNPYQQAVIDATMKQMGQANEQAQSGALGTAASSGAFGGDRAGIAAANLANQQGLAMGSTLAGLNAQNYNQALAAAQQQQGLYLGATQADLERMMQGGQFYAGLGQAAQQAGLQGAEAQINAGTLAQQTEQAGKTALYNQFQQQQAYPFQVAQFLANIAMGTGALSGSTTTTTQPGSFWSDRRLKEDIRRIGHTDDGLPIYKFKYKGDENHQTHIGFMADEVEQVKPEAVGVSGGYKTVDYDRATKAGGGGVAGPYGASVGSDSPYAGGYVPQAYLPVGELIVADSSTLQNAQNSMAQQLAAAAKLGESVKGLDSTWQYFQDIWGDDPRKEAASEAAAATGAKYALGGPAYLEKDDQQPVQSKSYLSDTLAAQEKDAEKRDMLTPSSTPSAPQSTLGQIGNAASSITAIAKLAAMIPGISDRRLKHDIRRIGRTDHGMPIYSFKYKGDDREQTHIGFMADEVEKHHPDAVSETAGGYKRVDYDQAHKFYQGGVVRNGYADGGTETLEERMRRLREMEAGAATNLLPSGVAPQPDRISAPVSYDVQKPEWTPIVTMNGVSPRAYEYDQNTGMVRDLANNQYVTNARTASRSDLGGVDVTEGNALNSARDEISRQQLADRQGFETEARNAEGMYERAAAAARAAGSSQPAAQQFPELYSRATEARSLADALKSAPLFGDAAYTPQSEIEISQEMQDRARAAGLGQRLYGNEPPPSLETPPPPMDTGVGLKANDIRTLMPPQRNALGDRLLQNEPQMLRVAGLVPAAGTPLDAYEMSPDDRPIPAPEGGLRPARLSGTVAGGDTRMAGGLRPVVDATTSFDNLPVTLGSPANAPAAPAAPAGGVTSAETRRDGTPYDMSAASDFYRTRVIPQESGGRQFDKDNNPLTSSAGAVGIGQILPSTGPEAAKLAGLEWDENRFYNDEKYNAALGEAYFLEQYRRFGSLDKAAAAYNAGPGALASAMDRATALGGSYLDYLPKETQAYVASTTGVGGFSGGADRRGLAAGILTPEKPYEDRNVVGKMFYNEDGSLNRNALLSLASGIGSMLASPSQFFLPTVGMGLQGFASTYAGLEKQAADIGQTQAETRRTNVEADKMRIYESAGGAMFINFGDGSPPVPLYDYLRNPEAYSTGDPKVDAEIMRRAQVAAGNKPQGTGVFATPEMQAFISREATNSERAPAIVIEQSNAIESAVNANAASSRSSIPSLLTQADAVSAIASPDAKVRAGVLGNLKQQAARYFNDLSATVSQITNTQLPLITDVNGTDASANAEEILKAAIQNGVAGANGYQEMLTIMKANPDIALSAEANSALMAGLMIDGRRDLRLSEFMRDYKAQDGNTNRTVLDAGQAFQQEYGEQINAEKAVLKELLHYGSMPMPPEWKEAFGEYATPMEFLMTPGIPVEAKNEFITKLMPALGVNPLTIAALSGPDGVYIGNYFGG